MRRGGIRETERARQASRRRPPRRLPVRRKRTRWRSRALRLGHADAVCRRSALRGAHRDPRAAAAARIVLEQPRVRDRDGQVDLGRKKRVRVVELGQKRLEERRGVELLRLLEEEVAAVLESPAADDENADRDVLSRFEEAEDVHVLALRATGRPGAPPRRGRCAGRPGRPRPSRSSRASDAACIFAVEARLELAVAPLEEEHDVGHGAPRRPPSSSAPPRRVRGRRGGRSRGRAAGSFPSISSVQVRIWKWRVIIRMIRRARPPQNGPK